MKKIILVVAAIAIVIVVLGAISSKKNGPGITNRSDNRLLSVDLSIGDKGFEESFKAGKELGIQHISLVVQWDELEPQPQQYDKLFLADANGLYSKQKWSATVGINPIDTFNLRTPSDVRGKKFNDPAVIDRYKKAVDFYLGTLKDVKIKVFTVGNEVDGYLGTSQTRWKEYEEFYKAVAPYIQGKLSSDAVVGTKIMQAGLTDSVIKNLAKTYNKNTDAVLVTYYPLNDDFTVKPPSVVRSDIDELMTIYPDKPVYFIEFGYPSSTYLNSSEAKQAEFVREMFKAWDAYKDRIPIITWYAISDLTKTDLDHYVNYYKITPRGFREYLGNLGLMKADGTRKEAFNVFKEEAKARGW